MTIETTIKRAFESALLDIAEEYQKNSPVGATGLLKSSWDINVFDSNTGLKGVISNDAPASRYRGLGRGSGKFPPVQPLREWVSAKGMATEPKEINRIAYLIGRKIATQGTNRWSTNTNPFYLNRDGEMNNQLKQTFVNKLISYIGE